MDIVEIAGFRRQLADVASCFADQTFTAQERQVASRRPSGDPAQHLAARFAAKEALIKAWSSLRVGRPPALAHVDMREIEVICDAWGRPTLRLHGNVARLLAGAQTRLSMSHDGGFASATVLLYPSDI
jgi:holo-[acyl-carrier protein] synthase